MTVRVFPLLREIVEILAIERENAEQMGTMEQTESSDGMIWIFRGKSGKQTDSRSSVLILPVRPFRRLSRLFRCSRFLLKRLARNGIDIPIIYDSRKGRTKPAL